MKVFYRNCLIASVLFASVSALPLTLYAQEEPRTAGDASAAKAPKEEGYNDTYKQLNLFGEVFERVRSQYVEKLTDKEIIEHALNGMLSSLDPHSSYLNEEKYNDMKVETRGEFGGLGIEITMENGLIKVVSPIDDTPAFRAGVQAGDYIFKIDDQAVMGMDLSEAVDKMRGKVGTTVDISIRREGVEENVELTLTRDVIKIQSVRSRVEGNAGYIRITSFNQNSDAGVKKAIEDISKELGNKLTGYVLDLRNNPGGLLDQAIAVSDIFMDKGEIVSTRGRSEEDTERDNATPGDLTGGLPVVVLINGGSASASEIVAGALQDHKRGIVMGTKSFGKGSVQKVIALPGNGAMRLTTARYFTPSGRSIQAMGIEPDILVEQAKIETLEQTRFSEADLRGAISNPNAPEKEEKKEDKPAEDAKEIDPVKAAKDGKDAKKEEKIRDYQLERAVDLLTGLSLYSAEKQADQVPASTTPAQDSPPPSSVQ